MRQNGKIRWAAALLSMAVVLSPAFSTAAQAAALSAPVMRSSFKLDDKEGDQALSTIGDSVQEDGAAPDKEAEDIPQGGGTNGEAKLPLTLGESANLLSDPHAVVPFGAGGITDINLYNALLELLGRPALLEGATSAPAGSELYADDFAAFTQLKLSSKMIASLEGLNLFDFGNVTSVSFASNELTTVQADIFQTFKTVQDINLNSCQISTVESNAFNGLPALTTLSMTGNSLGSLPSSMFGSTPSVESLVLHSNGFTSFRGFDLGSTQVQNLFISGNSLVIEPGDFAAMHVEGLKSLVCSQSGGVGALAASDFSALGSLEALTLTEMGVTDGIFKAICNSSLASSLKVLYLGNQSESGNNEITDISPVNKLTELQEIVLSGNTITDVSAFSGMSNLVRVNLADNLIASVPDSAFSASAATLVTLRLTNNRLTSLPDLRAFSKLATAAGNQVCNFWNNYIPPEDFDTYLPSHMLADTAWLEAEKGNQQASGKGTLQVFLKNEKGWALPGLEVKAQPQGMQRGTTIVTDASGMATFSLAPASYDIILLRTNKTLNSAPVVVNINGDVTENYTLQAADYMDAVTGVVSGTDGFSGLQVRLKEVETGKSCTAAIAANGYYHISPNDIDLTYTGAYELTLEGSDRLYAETVEIPAGALGEKEYNASFWAYPSQVTGVAKTSLNVPVPNAALTVNNVSYTAGPDGTFTLDNVKPGEGIAVTAQATGYTPFTGKLNVRLDKRHKRYSGTITIILDPLVPLDYEGSLKADKDTAGPGQTLDLRPVIHRIGGEKAEHRARVIIYLPAGVTLEDYDRGFYTYSDYENGHLYADLMFQKDEVKNFPPIRVRINENVSADQLIFKLGGYYTVGETVMDNLTFELLSVKMAGVTLYGPATHETGVGIKVYGNGTSGQQVAIKNAANGKVYATTTCAGGFYASTIDVSADVVNKSVELVAQMVVGSVTVSSQKLAITVDAGEAAVYDSEVYVTGRTDPYTVNGVYGVPTFTQFVDFHLKGEPMRIRFKVKNNQDHHFDELAVVFCGKDYPAVSQGSAADGSEIYEAVIENWYGSGNKVIEIALRNETDERLTPAGNVRIMIDPSGYVYDADTNARIPDVTVSLQKQQGSAWSDWEAPDRMQENPQRTDNDGRYGWYVEEGVYRVIAKKEGYISSITQQETVIANRPDGSFDAENPDGSDITVLPVQFDINIPMKKRPAEDSAISPDSAQFNKYPSSADYQDITIILTPNGNTLQKLMYGGKELQKGTDYTVSGDMVLISRTYLSTLPVGTAQITFVFSAGADCILSIQVQESSAPSISPDKVEFDKNQNSSGYRDISVTVSPSGSKVKGVAGNGAALSAGADYVCSGDAVIFTKEYLSALAVGSYSFEVTFETGETVALTVAIKDSTAAPDPDIPVDPDKPDVPDTPDEPDKPDVPDTPDEPDEPDTPNDPDTSSPIEPVTPPSGGGISSGSGSSKSRSSSDSGWDSASSTADTKKQNTVSGAQLVSQLKQILASREDGGEAAIADVIIRNVSSVSAQALRDMAQAAKEQGAKGRLLCDVVKGRNVLVRLYLDTSKAQQIQGDIRLGASVSGTMVKQVQTLFKKFFSNKIFVIHFDQKGEFGLPVEVAVKTGFTASDVGRLKFYRYDKGNNSYTLLENPSAYVDANGYLHFITDFGGTIVISDGLLSEK